MRFLVTGHTGFKGSWLTVLLTHLGHEVSGLALEPAAESLFALGGLQQLLSADLRVDIRDAVNVKKALASVNPDVIVHLAAQPLVRESYRSPRETFEVNVMGTYNTLEAASSLSELKALLVVTTDKVYQNRNLGDPFVESDPLGGDDPYSASKAMADILTQSWVRSFAGAPTAIARAGNVVGGGDFSPERLVPDTLRAFSCNEVPTLRYPNAVRPWQHVLDCVRGYCMLIDTMVASSSTLLNPVWNFGPDPNSFAQVSDVVQRLGQSWGIRVPIIPSQAADFPEAGFLTLDSTKAETQLGWRNLLDLETTLNWVVEWQVRVDDGESPIDVTHDQVSRHEGLIENL